MTRMRIKTALAATLLCSLFLQMAAAQQIANKEDGRLATIRGRLVDAGTGKGLEGAFIYPDSVKVQFMNSAVVPRPGEPENGVDTTDAEGRFTLRGVQPGTRQVTAVLITGFFNRATRFLEVSPGQEVDDLELRLVMHASARGQVLDDRGAPLQGVEVSAIVEEYHAGKVRQYVRGAAITNEDGVYELSDLAAGTQLRLMARWMPANRKALALADAPTDPKRRRPAYGMTFYPDSPDLQGGTELTLNSGERREGLDFRIRMELALCIEGKVVVPRDVQQVLFFVEEDQPHFGASRRGGMFGFTRMDLLDGKWDFRVCGLPAGSYRIRARDGNGTGAMQNYGRAEVLLTDRDLGDMDLVLLDPWKAKVEVTWAGRPPETMPSGDARITLQPVTRGAFMGEQRFAPMPFGGETELAAVWPDEFTASVRLPGLDPTGMPGAFGRGPADAESAPGVYVRDIRYGNASVRTRAFRFGSETPDTAIRVILDHGAGTVSARVSDGAGKAADNVAVYLLPMDATDEGDFAERLIVGQTDQHGRHTWLRTIPPGTYRAVATKDMVDYSPASIHALWLARSQATEIRVPENGSAEVSVTLGAR